MCGAPVHLAESYVAPAPQPVVGGAGRGRDPPPPWGLGPRSAVWATHGSTWGARSAWGWGDGYVSRRGGVGVGRTPGAGFRKAHPGFKACGVGHPAHFSRPVKPQNSLWLQITHLLANAPHPIRPLSPLSLPSPSLPRRPGSSFPARKSGRFLQPWGVCSLGGVDQGPRAGRLGPSLLTGS